MACLRASRSDGQAAAEAWQAGIYTAACTERVYSELLSRAGQLLALGESVIVDASFVSPVQRAAAAAAAAAAQADLVQLRCTAPAEVAGQRLAARTSGISDADEEIARQMAALDVPWPEAVTIDMGQPAAVPEDRPMRWPSRPSGQYGRTGQNLSGARSGLSCSPTERPRKSDGVSRPVV